MFRTGIPVLMILLMMAFGITSVTGQTQVDVDVSSEESSDDQPEFFSDPGLQKTVTIDADDASLPTVLSILAAESGYNIVTGPGVNKEERISIHLKETPIETAMNLVVRAAGLSYEIVGNSFLIATSAKLREKVGVTSYVIELQYANAEDIKKLLEEFGAAITVDKGGNKLLLLTSPKVIHEILRVIKEVDKPPLQIMLEARIIEVAVEEEEKLGIAWNRMLSYESILYEGPELPQTSGGGSIETFRGQMPLVEVNDLNNFGFIGRQQPVFDFAIDYLLKNNLAELLANSKIATMNNEEAVIEVVDVIPFIMSAGGVGGQVQTREKDVGVKLYIKPSVNTDGYITTIVKPEVSNVFQLIGPDQNIPWIVKRFCTTQIRVKDGESIVIAGLLGINRKYTMYKVPFLGDVPFIGGLFRHKSIQNKKTDLIIQITPHIIDETDSGIEKSKLIERIEEYVTESEAEIRSKLEESDESSSKMEKAEDAPKASEVDEDLDLLKESMQAE
ncbi:MAG: hypothetical protein P9L92_09070 [Candidatus Electryonea clarkiae]|nr:hypothetical protein [Candidatus Electryonea clarkiae]MDP8288689.1 hypothetical protein [Candidatus Electryonea clarkiae]